MLAVVNLHRARVDVRLQSVVRVRKRGKGERHSGLSCSSDIWYRSFPSRASRPPATQPSDDTWQKREKDHDEDYELDMVADSRNVAAQEISDEQHRPDPRQSPDDVVHGVPAVLHLPHASYDRHESPNNGHESRENDGLTAVTLIERMRALQVLPIEQERTLTREKLRSGYSANVV